MFEKLGFSVKIERAKKETKKKEDGQNPQLLKVFDALQNSPEVRDLLAEALFSKDPERLRSLKDTKSLLAGVRKKEDAFRLARKIDKLLGAGTTRKLSFLSKDLDAARSVLKILKKDIEKASFEKQAEGGYYLNVTENYGIQWSLEKTARDAWQNFFDANGQTLDGIKFESKRKETEGRPTHQVRISGKQEYDWRELVHIGATTKKGSTRTAGGFGEGTKDLALILLRDYGAGEVKFSSGDWEVDFYLDEVPRETYGQKIRGLYIKKRKVDRRPGNSLEITLAGEDAEKNVKAIEAAYELFYSSKNPDFQDSSFDNKETGGFKVLSPIKEKYGEKRQKGNFYQAGQRTHFYTRDQWNTVESVNIWTWEKILPKDRDRGMATRDDVEKKVIPFIVDSMEVEELKKSVYEFRPLWAVMWHYEIGHSLLEAIVKKLAKTGVKLNFPEEYLADDMPFVTWVKDLLSGSGHRVCPKFMADIGMRTVSERFKELQSHKRVQGTLVEKKRIDVLIEAAKAMGLEDEEIKEVWLFSAENEKNIFHGQYSSLFYWMAREVLGKDFLSALETYFHEAAHKKGPHGNLQFEYYLQEVTAKIRSFIFEKREKTEEYKREWDEANKSVDDGG